MSATPHAKADSRRVLTDYSDRMRKLLERGTVNTGKRPSQHHISPKSFRTDNGGAIPPNVLVPPDAVLSIPNTASRSPYRQACREQDVPVHPAAMPEALVEFFVRFLTHPGAG